MWEEVKGIIAMIVVQFMFAGMFILFKITADGGTNLKILVAYRLSFATLFMFPLAFIFERNKRPEFTWRLLSLAFISGLLGAAIPNILYLPGLALTSATFSAAISILGPFLGSRLYGLDRTKGELSCWVRCLVQVGLSCLYSIKVLRFISGQHTLTYSKARILIINPMAELLRTTTSQSQRFLWFLAVTFPSHFGYYCRKYSTVLACEQQIFHSFGVDKMVYVGYKNIGKNRQTIWRHYWNTSLMNAMGSLVCLIVALCSVHDWKQWRLGWNISLLATVYSGVVVSGMVVPLIAWCVEKKGPLYVTMFSPVRLVIVALFGSFALEEMLHSGSITGAIIMVGGVYLVVWCKMKETKSVSTTSSNPIGTNN